MFSVLMETMQGWYLQGPQRDQKVGIQCNLVYIVITVLAGQAMNIVIVLGTSYEFGYHVCVDTYEKYCWVDIRQYGGYLVLSAVELSV